MVCPTGTQLLAGKGEGEGKIKKGGVGRGNLEGQFNTERGREGKEGKLITDREREGRLLPRRLAH